MSQPPPIRCNLTTRIRVAFGLLFGLRSHDLSAAITFMNMMFPGRSLPVRETSLAKRAVVRASGMAPKL
jgi:hypothetical protein